MTATEHWDVRAADLDDPQTRALLEHHVATALAVTPRESAHAFTPDKLRDPAIRLWAIWDGGTLLGVGALHDLGGRHGEVKSMHTVAAARGRGVGSAMIRHIIAAARAHGFHRPSLETGAMDYFAPARALYGRAGFVRCAPYGDYRADPNSAYLTLDLAATAPPST
jgi:putative acetyltransferase